MGVDEKNIREKIDIFLLKMDSDIIIISHITINHKIANNERCCTNCYR